MYAHPMNALDRRFLCVQIIHVTLWSLWLGRWLVTWDPSTRRLRAWRP